MNSKLLTILKFVLLLAIAIGLLFFAFRGISVDKVFNEMMKANLSWIFLSVAVSIVALISRAYRWNLLIEPLGYSPQLKNTFYSLMVGYFANLAFPRLGEVTRCGSLAKAESIPFSSLLGTVIVERVVDVISLLICLILTAIIEYKTLGSFLMDSIIHPLIEKLKHSITSPPVIIAIAILVTAIFLLIRYFRNKARQTGKDSGVANLITELISGLRSIAKLKRPWSFVFHSTLIWTLYYISAYLCFFSLPATSHLGLTVALFVLVVGGLSMSAPVQGGIGVYHLLVSEGLMLYGLSKQDGLAFATLIHASQILLVVLLGSVSLLLLFLKNKNPIVRKESLRV